MAVLQVSIPWYGFFTTTPMRLLLFCCLCSLSSCWLTRAYQLRRVQTMDYRKLPLESIPPSPNPMPFTSAAGGHPGWKAYLDTLLEGTGTAAFLVVRNDSILYERYFNGFDSSTLLPTNSMTKSFTGTLAGIAIDEGIIHLSDPITKYLPELAGRDPRFRRITIKHLLDMRTGFRYNEGKYNLKDPSIRVGLSRNIEKQILRVQIAEPPGRFQYQSICTQMVGLILERVTGKPLAQYFSEKLWNPIGAEQGASWNMDSRKHRQVMISAGLNATARDMAKLGRLYLNKGRAGGRQLVSRPWVATVANMDTMIANEGYKYQWWSRMASRYLKDSTQAWTFRNTAMYAGDVQRSADGYRVNFRTGAFHASGFLGQIILVHPSKNLVIVRLGLRWKHKEPFTPFMYNLAEQL